MITLGIYYDGDCPFCSRYVRLLRLRDTLENIDIVNLRGDTKLKSELIGRGFNLDEGMVVKFNGQFFGGADAASILASLSTPSDIFNKINRFLLSRNLLAAFVYPILRSGRWISLFFLGRKGLIEENDELHSLQVAFSFAFSLFSLFHVFNYTFEYGRYPPQIDLVIVFLAAGLLFLRPQSSRALFLLMLASSISTIAQAPAQSNHTMLRTVVLIGYWLSFLLAWVRGTRWSDVFGNFVIAGRAALLVMYFFGIFHKVNSDFLNPATSCAVTLWRAMPPPLNIFDGPLIQYSVIYGTFIAEGAIMIALIFSRTRYLGMTLGILFHLLLAMSNYAAYLAFTTLSISLHVLFLSPANSLKIMNSNEMAIIRSRIKNPVYKFAATLLLISGALLMMRDAFSISTLFLFPFVIPICFLILKYGREPIDRSSFRFGSSAILIGIIVGALYFGNAFLPYIGLKTAQSINMFANIRLEAGVSNHLVFRGPPGPFSYLERVAVIDDPGGSSFLRWHKNHGFAIVYYDLLAHMVENPSLEISFTMNGNEYASVSADDFQDEIERELHPKWFRKWFHFQPVQLDRPERCSI